MNILKRILVSLLAASMLCASMVACNKQGPAPSGTEESTELQSENNKLLDDPILLCDATESYYRIIRPAASPDPVASAVSMIMKYPETQGAREVKLAWGSDKGDAAENEILVGYTNRPETKEVMDTLAYDDFAIVRKNGKIVVAAHKQERLIEATEYLFNNLLQIRTNANGKKELVYLGDYTFTGPQKYFFNAENQLKDYAIVYPKDSNILKEAAQRLQAELKAIYGVELSVVDDSVAERDHEILVGNVDRAIVKENIENGAEETVLSYVTVVGGTKILISSQNEGIIDYMIDSFFSKYIHPDYTYQFNLPADIKEVSPAVSFSESPQLADGANLRVMSFNILCELWNKDAVIAGREIPVIAPIFTYQPDILGLQEVSDAWYDALDPLLGETYAFADRITVKGETNFSPLLYNTETMTLLDHGVKSLNVGGNGLRVLSWGYLERKSDGARIVAINTHWNAGGEPKNETERVAQAKEMAEFVLHLKNLFKCPIVTTGDYNNRMSEDAIKAYVAGCGIKDACTYAKVVNRSIKTTHTLFSESTRGNGEAIDHVFATEELELLFYNVLIDKCLAPSSDHYPIYVDIKLSK